MRGGDRVVRGEGDYLWKRGVVLTIISCGNRDVFLLVSSVPGGWGLQKNAEPKRIYAETNGKIF